MVSQRRWWTEEEDLLVVQWREDGTPATEIGRRLGRSTNQVTRRFSRLVARGKALPMTRSQRARRAALRSGSTRPDRWTEDDDARVAALFSAGQSSREIADAIGRTTASVEQRVQKLRVSGAVCRLSREERQARAARGRGAITDGRYAKARERVSCAERTEAFGYVVGCLYGDASIETTRMSIQLKATNASFVESFASALEQSLGEPVRRLSRVEPLKRIGDHEYRDVRYYEAYLHRRHLATAISELTGDTTKLGWCLDVDRAFARGPAFCKGAIRGLFDSDGSFARVGRRGVSIRYGSTNEAGARAVYMLMLRLGFDVGLGLPTRKGERRVGVRMPSAERYAIEVSSGVDHKRAVLDGFLVARGLR
jgi:DNA-binding Lrp family transcriptional regulator